MHSAAGRVSAIHESGVERVAVVDIEISSTCQRCAEGRGCGAGILSAGPSSRSVAVRLDEKSLHEIGDEVRICVRSGSLLRAAAIVYGLPLAGATLGGAAAQVFTASDKASVIWVIAGLVSGLVAARRLAKDWRVASRFGPILPA